MSRRVETVTGQSGTRGKGEVGISSWSGGRGGTDGRKLDLIMLDDSYELPKTTKRTL